MSGFQPMRIGRRLLVAPPWLALAPEPGRIALRIDPGAAFGTGGHPSTQLCLLALGRHLKPGASVTDLGCGSGILAIAAAKLGAKSALALDIAPEALRAARDNVAANGVAEIVRVEEGSLAEALAAPTDWVLVNILAGVIARLFEEGLDRAVAPGGWLVLSGFVRAQTPRIRACLQWRGMELAAEEQMDEWVCMIARRSLAIRR